MVPSSDVEYTVRFVASVATPVTALVCPIANIILDKERQGSVMNDNVVNAMYHWLQSANVDKSPIAS